MYIGPPEVLHTIRTKPNWTLCNAGHFWLFVSIFVLGFLEGSGQKWTLETWTRQGLTKKPPKKPQTFIYTKYSRDQQSATKDAGATPGKTKPPKALAQNIKGNCSSIKRQATPKCSWYNALMTNQNKKLVTKWNAKKHDQTKMSCKNATWHLENSNWMTKLWARRIIPQRPGILEVLP